jgi:hypothetical protein
LGQRNIVGGLEHAIADFLGSFNLRIDRGDHTHEDELIWFHVLSDYLEHSLAVFFNREGHIEIAGIQLEQAGKEFSIINLGAVGGIPIATGARMHTDFLAIGP